MHRLKLLVEGPHLERLNETGLRIPGFGVKRSLVPFCCELREQEVLECRADHKRQRVRPYRVLGLRVDSNHVICKEASNFLSLCRRCS